MTMIKLKQGPEEIGVVIDDFATAFQEEALGLDCWPALSEFGQFAPRSTRWPRRPAYAVLDKAATIADFGLTPIHWRMTLRQMAS